MTFLCEVASRPVAKIYARVPEIQRVVCNNRLRPLKRQKYYLHTRTGDPEGRVTPRSHMECIGGGTGQQEGRGCPPVARPKPAWCLRPPTRLARRPSPAARRRPRPRTARAASVESPTGMARRSGKVRKKSGGRPPCAAGSEGGRCVCVAACVRAGEAAAGVVPAARLKDAARRRRAATNSTATLREGCPTAEGCLRPAGGVAWRGPWGPGGFE